MPSQREDAARCELLTARRRRAEPAVKPALTYNQIATHTYGQPSNGRLKRRDAVRLRGARHRARAGDDVVEEGVDAAYEITKLMPLLNDMNELTGYIKGNLSITVQAMVNSPVLQGGLIGRR